MGRFVIPYDRNETFIAEDRCCKNDLKCSHCISLAVVRHGFKKARRHGRRKNLPHVELMRAWAPAWRVLCDTDALPGQNAGRPVPLDLNTNGAAVRKLKSHCDTLRWGGFVLAQGTAYFRESSACDLEDVATSSVGSALCLSGTRENSSASVRDRCSVAMRMAIIATHDEFDETVYAKKDVGTTMAGNGRKFAMHALINCVLAMQAVELVALLILDWKHGDAEMSCATPLSKKGPQVMQVGIHRGPTISAWRGTYEQLFIAVAGDLNVDVAIASGPRRDVLQLMHGSIDSKRYVVMGHDYNLPFGPWGTRELGSNNELHQSWLSKTTMLCTSQHLSDYVQRWSQGLVESHVCYCADYDYFDDKLPCICADGECVTFISPCPAKGLCIFLRLAVELPQVKFLAVSTLWTMTIHEEQLRKLPNVELVRGGSDVHAIYQRTSILLVPSLWSEAFGLVAFEAQLRGIPVISTQAYGLKEANLLLELQVPDVKLVSDLRIRTLHHGATIDELEQTLDHDRSIKHLSDREIDFIVRDAHCYVATPAEVTGFASLVQKLWNDASLRRHYGQVARQRAAKFLSARRGCFKQMLETWQREHEIRYEACSIHDPFSE